MPQNNNPPPPTSPKETTATTNRPAGDDAIYTYEGNDIVFGSGGDDAILAGTPSPRADRSALDANLPESDRDEVHGNKGRDSINGNADSDTITLAGGGGSDTFVVSSDESNDTIVNFEIAVDTIAIVGFDNAEIEYILDAENNNTAIAIDGQILATLENSLVVNPEAFGNLIQYEAIEFST